MVSALQHVSDFANLFKAFIGANYLSMPFAFKESGLALGIVLLLVIAILTDHCCHLMVVCKRLMVQSLCSESDAGADAVAWATSDGESGRRADSLLKRLMLGDIAKFTYGRPGLYLVNASLFVTQFGFCVNYFIFIGNTLQQVLLLGTAAGNATDANAGDDSGVVATWSSPPLWLLVAAPLPLFLGFALVRNIRSMGSVSVVANLSICAGVVAVLAVMLLGLVSACPTVVQAKIATLPVYIGIVAVSYEGIGTVIPIESSMEGNRHNFRGFLRGALLCVTGILGTVGAVGYLRYGEDAKQILVQNLPAHSAFVVALDATLILGVIFTFPLQVFPVVQMVENFCLPRYSAAPDEQESLIPSSASFASVQDDPDAVLSRSYSPPPDTTPTWQRNCLRFAIVLCQLAMAMLLRNMYAYVSAFIGAVGSIFLAFVLPCAVHLRLLRRRPGASRLVMAKDACVCGLGCLASATSLFVTMTTIVAPHFFD